MNAREGMMRAITLFLSFIFFATMLAPSASAQSKKYISMEEAITLAERFVREHGYTKEPATTIALAHGSIPGVRKNGPPMLLDRHDTLEAEAYGVVVSKDSWSVVFPLTETGLKRTNSSYIGKEELGRLVEMDAYGQNLSIRYQPVPLRSVDLPKKSIVQKSTGKELHAEQSKKVLYMGSDECSAKDKQGKAILHTDPQIQEKFDKLYGEWEAYLNRQSGTSSNSDTYTVNCPAFNTIVTLGEPVIPCIMKQYLHGGTHWWTIALERITGIGKNSKGWNFEKRRQFWTDWWEWKQGAQHDCPKMESYDPDPIRR